MAPTPFIAVSGAIGSWPCIGRASTVAGVVASVGDSPGTVRRSPVKAGAALVRGPLGGGTTRLVDEVVAVLDAKGRIIRRIVATSATSAVPFGAVVHLLPVGPRDSADPLVLIASLRDVLAADGDERPVLVIDDAPLLDVATAGVIATLAGSGAVHVVASARDDEPLPDPLVDVLLGGGAYGVSLAPLSEDDIDTLLHLVPGGPVDGSVLLSMRDRSGGNPLFLRELTPAALDSGALVEVGGAWMLRGAAPGSTRLREVVEVASNWLLRLLDQCWSCLRCAMSSTWTSWRRWSGWRHSSSSKRVACCASSIAGFVSRQSDARRPAGGRDA